jgi:hypothetical protein
MLNLPSEALLSVSVFSGVPGQREVGICPLQRTSAISTNHSSGLARAIIAEIGLVPQSGQFSARDQVVSVILVTFWRESRE